MWILRMREPIYVFCAYETMFYSHNISAIPLYIARFLKISMIQFDATNIETFASKIKNAPQTA